MSEAPGEVVLDFEEYTRLYYESWSDPAIRWLMSTVSTLMIFDDHDVHDDWNISEAWLEEARSHRWWNEHIKGALSSYWVYQHLGNLAPASHKDDELLAKVKAADDAENLLEEFARGADHRTDGSRWSYCRDLGTTRLIVIDSRAGRVVDEGRRSMLDDQEWEWLYEHATGGFDHLLIGTSLPWLLGRGMHYAEAWNEAVAGGAWGPIAAKAAEKMRQSVDMEHWAAWEESFTRLVDLFRAVGTGDRGEPPASIVALSGDVHHAYLAEVGYPRGTGMRTNVWQAVCSPYRNPLEKTERNQIRIGMSREFEVFARTLARLAGVRDPGIGWRMIGDGPWFDNQVATLIIDGREIHMRLDKAVPVDEQTARLECVLEHRLA